ncbi:molybdopterin molybdenumtransferase [bacterium BMS3Bbin03]|nr:molybdopterin molybdenumtransferase [bacterium BMS3Bbin03]
MISVKEALSIITAHVTPAGVESVPLSEAMDRVPAEDVRAAEPSPRFTNSAMDGFAVRWETAVREGSEVKFLLTGESRAGDPFEGVVKPGEAVRISTGAVLPKGTDAVIPIEDAKESGHEIRVGRSVRKFQHVRFKGEEFKAGEIILKRGDVITPAAIGLLASQGITSVAVFRRPSVSIVGTGTELMPLKAPDLKPGQIRDSNSLMLCAAVTRSGAQVVYRKSVGDELDDVERILQQAAGAGQIILFSGGVSVGPHDLVRQAAEACGFETLFWKVRQKPGKPLFFAKKQNKLLFGLPGNPVSSLSCYAYYVHPVLRKMMGAEFEWQIVKAKLSREMKNPGDRAIFVRVAVRRNSPKDSIADPLTKQGSHRLTSMVQADGFILLEPGERLSKGCNVDVYLYPWRA